MVKKKVLVIGLDCAAPQLVFDQWNEDLPNLRRLMAAGVYGELESTIPPITCPAWMSMMTSKDPGQLGVYGFRNRKDYSYHSYQLTTSHSFAEPAVWDILSQQGRRVILLSVPPSFPPKPINGDLVTCFMTPGDHLSYTHPPSLKREVEQLVGRYQFDVDNFRSEDKQAILTQLYQMAEKRFTLLRHLMRTRDWDFAMMVEIGVDRLHHGFWKYFDPTHRKYQPGSPLEGVGKDYYIYLDQQIGETLSLIDEQTTVFIVSDHGAKKLDGAICINQWLIGEGYLKLKKNPTGVMPLEKADVDWEHTLAWGEGGYHANIYLNVRGREPHGVVEPNAYEQVRDELTRRLQALTDEQGRRIGARVFKPQEIYQQCRGIAPDLIVYLGDLLWRSVGSVGHPSIWILDDSAGPDDANHAQHGIFIMSPCSPPVGRRLDGLHLMDCAPTILHQLGVPVPSDMRGRIIGG
ncbi:MAG: alkaline phosphatase family protein [Acidobacteriota bacterium]|nr:alkaline phosphatase family protein [Blastocatellia bacterium]MDW8238552.1 alkaline phosphatase family protein [Acidobacteriota bacterium]